MSEADDTVSELEKLKAELRAVEARRTERSLSSAAAEELAAVKLELANSRALEAAEAKYGALDDYIATYSTKLGVVIVRRPHHVIYKRFADKQKLDMEAIMPLIKNALAYPDYTTFEGWLEELPGIAVPIANVICRLAGVRTTEISEK